MSDPAGILDALAKLGAGDRHAILQRLSAHERTLLTKLADPRSALPMSTSALNTTSPWLAKRLRLIMDDPHGSALVTSATRAAVEAIARAPGSTE